MKKLIAIPIFIFVFYILNLMLYTGLADPFLRLKSALSNDVIITENQCGNEYGWRVVEKDTVKTGNLFEIGTKSEIISWRHFQITYKGKIVVDKAPYSENGDYGQFPAGESFTKMYVFDKNYFQDNIVNYVGQGIHLKSSEISIDDFDKLGECIAKDRTTINQSLGQAFGKNNRIGWIMRLDNTIRDFLADAPIFMCEDGKEIVISGGLYLGYNSGDLNGRIGIVKPDGKTYKWTFAEGGNSTIVPLPTTKCTNKNNQTLTEYLQTIPDRITVLD
jgi:hypothetical protein